MNLRLLFPLLVTTIVAILGWIVAHRFTMKRDRASKRRELRTTYLIEAYRRLERVVHREVPLPNASEDLESAIADIHLFGTARQVMLAQEFVRQFTEQGNGDISDLLIDLRRELREELQLDPIPAKVAFLRISREVQTRQLGSAEEDSTHRALEPRHDL